MAVYGYARVSTDKQAQDGESLEVQERRLRGWCLMQGEEMAEMYIDRGVSGSTPLRERPESGALLKRLKAGDTLVAANLDRMFRSALDALQTVEALKAKKVRVWLLDLGDVTGNGMAKAFLTMAAAFAELERDQIRQRVSGVKKDQRERGRYLGGAVPFGLKKEQREAPDGRKYSALVMVQVEQEIIAEAQRLRSAGMSFRVLQKEIDKRHGRYLALATLKRITDEQPATV